MQVLNSLKFLKYYIFFWKQIQPQISSSYICPDFLLCLSWTEKRNIFFYCLSRRIWTNFKCKYLCFESNRHKADIVLNNFLGQMAKWQQWNQPNGRATLNSGLRNTGLLLMRLIRCFCAFFFFFEGIDQKVFLLMPAGFIKCMLPHPIKIPHYLQPWQYCCPLCSFVWKKQNSLV